jgi:H+/gluconate symporter-like permease
MFIPSKHTNLELCPLRISSFLIKIIKKKRMIAYEEVVQTLIKKFGEDVLIVFIPSISIMYLLGLVEYNSFSDSFEYIKNEVK